MEITEVREQHLEAKMTIRPDFYAPNGYLHAGSLVGFADSLAGYATVAHFPLGVVGFTTIELKTNFLSTAKTGEVWAIATPEHLGKTTQVWDVLLRHGDTDKKMALFRCTQMLIYPEKKGQ
ncbi:MAG: PaaI family thioesterase [Microscillaceae bacterium]|nr:PaaI family thioesterase [Microscillaceae bacterium]